MQVILNKNMFEILIEVSFSVEQHYKMCEKHKVLYFNYFICTTQEVNIAKLKCSAQG